NYFIDANTGSILKFNSTNVHDGPANVQGYGSRIIDTKWKGGFTQAYILETNDAGRTIHTKEKSNGGGAWSLINNVTDGDDDWGGSHLIETSTHYHVSNSWDYFKQTFSREGQDNGGIEVRVRTQWDDPGAKFNPGNNSHNNLTFGRDGNAHYGTEASIVGHEYTHGVTYHTSNLAYENESGALNESFSDIFGVVIQAQMLEGGATDWIIGNDIQIDIQKTRSLEDPKSRGEHLDNGVFALGQPDTYEEEFWYTGNQDNGGVHINSGVPNKWFYILANGESDWNDLNDFYDVDGIGMHNASWIAHLANTSILMSSSQFTDARQATITVAQLLLGDCSVEHQATVDAWYAVGVGDEHDCTFTASIKEIENADLLIYPNPANQVLNVELPHTTEENIQVLDMTGKMVKSFKNNNRVFKTDIRSLEEGMYIIRFRFDGQVVNKRFIVQK
ncbi:MAG: M4 family metallopeptidase, partial [Brumimicrobium sp.]